jgi:hypothetical protein
MNYAQFQQFWSDVQHEHEAHYKSRESSFIPFLLPEEAISKSFSDTFELLAQHIGPATLREAFDPQKTISSPLEGRSSTAWMKRANMVGINVRTIQHFWNVVKYCFTLPAAYHSIHLLPIWEPGVVASLYGMASWNINPEFFSQELYEAQPQLDTVEKQLKVVINILHATGRTVGFDAIPHTDRYSEIVLANPQHFEWLRRKEDQIVDHSANLHLEVQLLIWQWLQKQAPAVEDIILPDTSAQFFSPSYLEENRLLALFGYPRDYGQRAERRSNLLKALYKEGFEPVPATMAPPYRGLIVNPDASTISIDQEGMDWREYIIEKPHEMSRVFGPLTRYKMYERINDNQDWEIDFSQPRHDTWHYFLQHFKAIQQEYHFDFMRGDMSHVQMRPDGVPQQANPYYDFHQAIKENIQAEVPYFAYYAETFLTAPNFMAYGNEADHLELSKADVTLGDLQSMVSGSKEFMANFRWYLDLAATRAFSPCFTIMTGDKDDPRFDRFYLSANEARMFIGFFLTDMPSYMGLGFECRDVHDTPAPNEHYTKLYVFKIDSGHKATQGPYVFGKNAQLFYRLSRIRQFAEQHLDEHLLNRKTLWLLPPDATAGTKVIAWTQHDSPQFIFIANLDGENTIHNLKVPTYALQSKHTSINQLELLFSTHHEDLQHHDQAGASLLHFQIDHLDAGECRVYRGVGSK